MLRTLMISATGMSAQQTALDIISHNLANVNTTGFKSSQANFADLFYQQVAPAEETDAAQPGGVGLGVSPAQVERSFTQGQLQTTGNTLDLAVQGQGFFQVLRPDGSLGYTRDGSFSLNAEGVLCTAQGCPLVPEIRVPDDTSSILVGADGTVSVQRAGQSGAQAVGQLELAGFMNPGGLENLGHNLYASTVAAGDPMVNTPGQDGLGLMVQGSLERSNVNLVEEMVNLILTQRAYEVNTKSIQAADEMMRMTNNLRR
ncbi:MAG: flagellar basal-body rod protein FlgG [candidate division FCPU426 bacterium]